MNIVEKTTILVVDDEPLNVELLATLFKSKGYEVVTAENGGQALRKLTYEKIDLVLLDVMMPDMDGFEVTRKIRAAESTKTLPVVMITALAETSARISGIEAGCDDFISKPFDINEVLAKVKTLLQLHNERSRVDEKKKLEKVIERASEGLIVCDADLRIVRSNQLARELLSFVEPSPDWLDRLHQTFKVHYEGELKTDLVIDDLDFDLERPEFPTYWPLILSFSSRVIRDSQGRTTSVVIILHDVTEQRGEKHRKANFLNLIAQKVHAPLNLSLGHLAQMKEAFVAMKNTRLRDSAEATMKRLAEFSKVMEKITDFVNVDTAARYGGKGVGEGSVYMDRIEGIVKAILKKHTDKEIEYTFDLPGSMVGLRLSPVMLEILLSNLIENAVKFNDQKIVKLTFTARQEQGLVRFSVGDNGPGIPCEERQKIFDTFYQVDKEGAGDIPGIGLGLAIAKRIVESHQGEIKVDFPSKGDNSISFSLPLAAASEKKTIFSFVKPLISLGRREEAKAFQMVMAGKEEFQ